MSSRRDDELTVVRGDSNTRVAIYGTVAGVASRAAANLGMLLRTTDRVTLALGALAIDGMWSAWDLDPDREYELVVVGGIL